MINFLSSLRLTTFLLTVICGWLLTFVPMARSGGRPFVKLLNQSLVNDWFANGSQVGTPVKFWFIGLGLLMALLAVNLIVCTLKRFRPDLGRRPRRLLMFFIHLIFGCQLLAHGAGFFMGWRPPPATLNSGERIELNDGWELEVKEIIFVDDPAILKKPRKQWTTKDFSYRENGANVCLRRDGSEFLRGRVATYQPLNRDDLQITLKGFKPSPAGPAAEIQVTRSPFAKSVLWLFHILIILFSAYLILTWQRPGSREADI